MQKVSLQPAVKMTNKSESTLRRDGIKGKDSADRDERRHIRFDIAEMQRAYGDNRTSTEQGMGKAMIGHDSILIL